MSAKNQECKNMSAKNQECKKLWGVGAPKCKGKNVKFKVEKIAQNCKQ
jgi:hypothetical protein